MVEVKASAITDEFSSEFDKACEHLQSRDVDHVELRNVLTGNILQIDDRATGHAKDILNECGLKVSALATPLMKCLPPSINPEPLNSTDYNENWRYNYSLFDRALELADFFDTRYIRCFGYKGKFPVPPVSEWASFHVFTEWSEVVSDYSARAAARGKMLVCENEGGLVAVLDQMEHVGSRLCGPGFGLLYDTANVARKEGENGVLTEEWLPRLAPCIQYVHAKGCKATPLGGRKTCLVNGPGDMCRWPRLVEYFRAITTSDFVAPAPNPLFFSIETHMGKRNRLKHSDASLRNLQALLA